MGLPRVGVAIYQARKVLLSTMELAILKQSAALEYVAVLGTLNIAILCAAVKAATRRPEEERRAERYQT